MPPKYLTLIRHAQGYHNLTENYSLPDPCLTPTGLQQCSVLNKSFLQDFPSNPSSLPPPPPPTLLVSSPLTRTLQTTLCSFSTFLTTEPNTDMKIIPLALLQESSDVSCDTGRPAEVIKEEFSGRGPLTPPELGEIPNSGERIAWEFLDPVFPKKEGIYEGKKEALIQRAFLARKWLWERDEEHIVAVLHGGFVHYLTEDWSGHTPAAGTGWNNTEYRTFEFLPIEKQDSPSYSIREIEWSVLRRGVQGQRGKPLGKTEKKEYTETVEKGNEDLVVEELLN